MGPTGNGLTVLYELSAAFEKLSSPPPHWISGVDVYPYGDPVLIQTMEWRIKFCICTLEINIEDFKTQKGTVPYSLHPDFSKPETYFQNSTIHSW